MGGEWAEECSERRVIRGIRWEMRSERYAVRGELLEACVVQRVAGGMW